MGSGTAGHIFRPSLTKIDLVVSEKMMSKVDIATNGMVNQH
jgi:hypothetical protein